MKPLQIGEVAERTGVSLHTIRYYEGRGLLQEPPRTPAGYRQYGDEHVARLRFVRRAQALGFTLEEIRELLDLRAAAEAPKAPGVGLEVRERASEKVAEIDEKVHDLQRIREELAALVHACDHNGSPASCLVLGALEAPEAV